MALCTISGTVKDTSDTAVVAAVVRANITAPTVVGSSLIVPKAISTTTAADGTWSLAIVQLASVIVTIEYPLNANSSRVSYSYTLTAPATSTANFHTLATEA